MTQRQIEISHIHDIGRGDFIKKAICASCDKNVVVYPSSDETSLDKCAICNISYICGPCWKKECFNCDKRICKSCFNKNIKYKSCYVCNRICCHNCIENMTRCKEQCSNYFCLLCSNRLGLESWCARCDYFYLERETRDDEYVDAGRSIAQVFKQMKDAMSSS